jgi:hypothetical protein
MDQENKKDNGPIQGKEIHHHHYYKKSSSFFGRLTWGLVIIFIGLLFLGQNAGLISTLQMSGFFATFWPVFIIFAGLSILAKGHWLMGIISTLITLAILGLILTWFFSFPLFGVTVNPEIKTDANEYVIYVNWVKN